MCDLFTWTAHCNFVKLSDRYMRHLIIKAPSCIQSLGFHVKSKSRCGGRQGTYIVDSKVMSVHEKGGSVGNGILEAATKKETRNQPEDKWKEIF